MTAYVISEVRVLDDALAQRYRDLAAASIARYGGCYPVRGTVPEAAEGAWDDRRRLIIVEFPTAERLREWYTSAEYAVAPQIRERLSIGSCYSRRDCRRRPDRHRTRHRGAGFHAIRKHSIPPHITRAVRPRVTRPEFASASFLKQ